MMSKTLTPKSIKHAAESTVHTLSDLVDEARDRIEDLPIGRSRRRNGKQKWMALLVLGLLAVTAMVVGRRRHNGHDRTEPATPPSRERSFAAMAS